MSADGSMSFDFHELIVDSFAGGGGASTGIERALGRPVDIAVNHDGEALAMHEVNHPQTRHLREDVWALDPRAALGNRQIGLLWASPDCKHFSKAKGGKPVSKRIRGLAWVVCKWASATGSQRPRVIMLENVEEFQDWGPLKEIDGKLFPDPERKGITFQRFVGRLRKLGYKVEWKQLRASEYGTPTIRKRLFLIARRDGLPIVWPAPTHGKGLAPFRTAAECIDWSIPCPSIFERKKPLADATLKRIARGVMRYVVNSPNPFIVPIANYGSGARVNDIDQPLTTITAHPKGGAHAVVVPHITKFRANSTGSGLDEPMHTVTASSFVKRPGGAAPLGLVSATLQHATHGGRDQSLTEPAPTVTGAHRGELQVIAATMIQAAHGDGKPGGAQRWGSGACDIDKPMGTLTASNSHALIAATMVQTGYGERAGQAPRALDIEAPLGTVVGGAAKHAVVAAFLAQHNTMPAGGVHSGHDARKPLSTLSASGAQQQVVTSHLLKLRGTCKDGQPVTDPMPTVTGGGTHAAEVRSFLIKYYGTDQDPRLEEPLHTISTKDRFGLVTVHGEFYQIVDIGMRMLTPRELANAQGFPPDYVIDRKPDGTPLTKTAQVRMIGNSVCPPLAEALVRANFAHELKPAKNRRAA